jgi:hypothetical protein
MEVNKRVWSLVPEIVIKFGKEQFNVNYEKYPRAVPLVAGIHSYLVESFWTRTH